MKKRLLMLLIYVICFTINLNATSVKNPDVQFVGDNEYKISYIAQKTEIETELLINLKVQSRKQIETSNETFSKNSSVILLIDVSGTMENFLDKSNPETCKLDLIKKYARNFILNFYANSQNELAIITFDSDANSEKNLLQAFKASNCESALASINEIKGNGNRSNLKLGLELAKQELLNAVNDEKIIIAFSDCITNDYEATINDANLIKNSGVKIFSFFVGKNDETAFFEESKKLMSHVSGIENIYFADNALKIEENLQSIDGLLMKRLRPGTIQVQIPTYFKFEGFVKDNIMVSNGNFLWDLTSSNTVYNYVYGNDYKHHYQLNYTISFNDNYEHFMKESFYPVNSFSELVCQKENKEVFLAAFKSPEIAKEANFLIDYKGGSISVNYGENLSEQNVATAVIKNGKIINYTLKFGESLPQGLILHADGTISGTAQNLEAGKSFIVIATANNGAKAQATWTLIITKASLIITADTIEKLYKQEFISKGTEFSVTGLVNGEFIESVILRSNGFDKDALFGEYEVIVSNLKAGQNFNVNNYNICYKNGILKVNANHVISVSLKSQVVYEGGDSISGDDFPSPAFAFNKITEKLSSDIIVEDVHDKQFDHVDFLLFDRGNGILKNYDPQSYDGLLYPSPFRVNHYLDAEATQLVETGEEVNAQTYYMRLKEFVNEIYAYDRVKQEFYQFVMKEEESYASCKILPITTHDEYPTKFVPIGNMDDFGKLDVTLPIVKEDSAFTDSSGKKIEDPSGIVLLQDGLIYPETKEKIENKINDLVDFSPKYEIVYFEFLNRNNSNDIVTNSENVEIFMPYPQGINTSFKTEIYHFTNIKRELEDKNTDYETFEKLSEKNENLNVFDNGVLFSTKSFSPFAFIYSKDINHETLSIELPKDVIFNQSEQKLRPIILDNSNNDNPLVENVDFKLDYDNCIDIGTVTVKVSGIGNYSGERFFTFQITKFTSSLEILKDYLTNNEIKNVVDENLPFYREIIEWQDNLVELGKNNVAMQEAIDNANDGKWSIVLKLREGWNLISSPFVGTDIWNCKSEKNLSNMWKYCVKTNLYEEFSRESNFELSPGVGYWLLANKTTQIVISGTRTTNSFCGGAEGINFGWNLIGMVENVNLKTDEIMGAFRQEPNLAKPIKFDSIFEQERLNDSYRLIPEDSILQIGKGYWGFFM